MVADKNLFFFKVREEDKDKILDNSHVFIAGRAMVIQKWSPSVEEHTEKPLFMPVWEKIKNLPREL